MKNPIISFLAPHIPQNVDSMLFGTKQLTTDQAEVRQEMLQAGHTCGKLSGAAPGLEYGNGIQYMAKMLIDNKGNWTKNSGNMARTILKDAISYSIDMTLKCDATTRTTEVTTAMWTEVNVGVEAFQSAIVLLIGSIPFVGGFLASVVSWLINWAYMIIQRVVD